MSVHIAAPASRKIVPSFVVKELEGDVAHKLVQFDKEGKKYVKEVKRPAGFMVSFPTKGHSIRVATVDALKRLGFDRTIPMVDASSDDDDVVGTLPNNVNVR